jgi:hypothetical protein
VKNRKAKLITCLNKKPSWYLESSVIARPCIETDRLPWSSGPKALLGYVGICIYLCLIVLITGKYFVNLQVKGSPVRHVLPSTGMAAHAIDDLNEAIELEDRHESIDALLENDADDKTRSPAIPLQPPPVVQNAYEQYEGDDEEVDVE